VAVVCQLAIAYRLQHSGGIFLFKRYRKDNDQAQSELFLKSFGRILPNNLTSFLAAEFATRLTLKSGF